MLKIDSLFCGLLLALTNWDRYPKLDENFEDSFKNKPHWSYFMID